MKKLVLMVALLTVPVSISVTFDGSCSGEDNTHADKKKVTK